MSIIIDGLKVVYAPLNEKKRGKGEKSGAGANSEIPKDNWGIAPVSDPTELGEVITELNSDDFDAETQTTSMDMKGNLMHLEVASLLALDSLVSLKVLPPSVLPLSRQKKRLSVSVDALGRRNIVDIVAGNREHEQQGGLKGFANNFKKNFLGIKSEE